MEFDQSFFDEGVWRLSPDDEVEEEADSYWPTPLTAWIEEEFCGRCKCPYCASLLKECTFDLEGQELLFEESVEVPDIARLWTCRYCAYWQWYSLFENRGLHGHAAMSILRRFEPSVPEGCLAELAQHLRRNEQLWHRLDPSGMEKLVTELFRENYSHVEVLHVGRPGDRGV
jgi:hypothetical protein